MTTPPISPSNQGAPQPAPTADELRQIVKRLKQNPICRAELIAAWACEQCAARIEAEQKWLTPEGDHAFAVLKPASDTAAKEGEA